ncbi:16S rRNA (uracil(1498)-N(3))-methyltransferase [Polaromonas sp.]|uniref:16S rRNA (uracil(1498)-N(3))-methyltransferase n=1 Tax=Polaromonas sp. TaxID=1869339 RepID=UPI002FC9C560
MPARFYADLPLHPGASVSLPAHAARHVQVLRLQPGERITLFNGLGGQGLGDDSTEGEFEATIERMGRSEVQVLVGAYSATAREAGRAVHLVLGMPANERMDWLVEKATELGVASIQPLMAERSVLRLTGERAAKKLAHWRGVAIAACEQCGRNRVPVIHEALAFAQWAAALQPESPAATRLLLSLRPGTQPLAQLLPAHPAAGPVTFLSGPEGGLSAAEEDAAMAGGFAPVTLGPRVLRAETAPLAGLSLLVLTPP